MQKTLADTIIGRISGWFSNASAPGILLLSMVVLALIWANSPWQESYFHFFESEFTIGLENFNLTKSIHVWINDGLMAIFFFKIGLEIKREIIEGELATWKRASLPVFAALGGMLVPAALFFAVNHDGQASHAWGIPMATDIAFTLGLVALLGSRVSTNLKVFLTALATVDDIGAILVIALFLTPSIDIASLMTGGLYLLIMIFGNYIGVRSMWFYLTVGILGLWVAILLSGIHATLAGVLGALTIPANRKITEKEYKDNLKAWVTEFEQECTDDYSLVSDSQANIISDVIRESNRAGTPLQKIESGLNPLVNMLIVPLFALSNAGVRIGEDFFSMVFHPVSIGVIFGLVVGKFIGITFFSRIMVKMGIANLPSNTSLSGIAGIAAMAGVGFTMSLFIAELALKGNPLLENAKIGILTASLISATIGILWFYLKQSDKDDVDKNSDNNLIMSATSTT